MSPWLVAQLTSSDSFPMGLSGPPAGVGGAGALCTLAEGQPWSELAVRVLSPALPSQKEMLRPSCKDALGSRGFGNADVRWAGLAVRSETPRQPFGILPPCPCRWRDYAAEWMGREDAGRGGWWKRRTCSRKNSNGVGVQEEICKGPGREI